MIPSAEERELAEEHRLRRFDRFCTRVSRLLWSAGYAKLSAELLSLDEESEAVAYAWKNFEERTTDEVAAAIAAEFGA